MEIEIRQLYRRLSIPAVIEQVEAEDESSRTGNKLLSASSLG
jgi:hypothetical protein